MDITRLYDRPKLTLLVILTVAILSAVGLTGLSVTADLRVFFSQDNPELQAFEEQEALFYQGDGVVYAVDGDIYSRRGIEALTWVTRAAELLPYLQRAESIINFQHARKEDGEMIVNDLFPEPEILSDEEFSASVQRSKLEAVLQNRLVTPNGKAAFVVATLQMPGKNIQQETPHVVKAAKAIADEFRQKFPNYKIYLTGMVPFNHQMSAATISDLKILLPICFSLCLILLGVLLRGFIAVVITTAVICASVLVAMGVAGWFGLVLNTATAAAPVIIMTLAIAHSVHLIESFRVARESTTQDRDALDRAMQINLQPVFLTCLTTTIGFLCMNFSDAPPFRELGNVVAVGVIASGLFAYTLLPALALVLQLGGRDVENHDGDGEQSRKMQRFGAWVVRYRTPLLIFTTLVSIPLVHSAFKNELNDQFRLWYPKSNEVRAGLDFMLERTGGSQQMFYTLDSGKEQGVSQNAYFTQAEALANWFRAHPHVASVASYTDILKRMNRVLRDDLPEQYRLPENADMARQFLLVYEFSLPQGHSLNNMVDLGKQSSRLTVTMKATSSQQIRQLDAEAQAWMAENTPAITTPGGSGTSKMFAELGQRNIRSMMQGSLLALVLISGLILVALRSWVIGLISLIPNLLPVGLGFGVWYFLSGEINIALSVVMGMTLGIIVDDTVHFLSKYLRARRELGLTAKEAIPVAFGSVARALWVTTVVLVAGFMVLSASSFLPTADMGKLTAITIALALFADFLLLPPLLIWLDRGEHPIN